MPLHLDLDASTLDWFSICIKNAQRQIAFAMFLDPFGGRGVV